TYSGVGSSTTGHPCPSSEAITVTVSETADRQVTATFSSSCYKNEGTAWGARFYGKASKRSLTGQMAIHQGTCREEGGYIDADGTSSGSFDANHIHLKTPDLGTADCGFGGNVIDIKRSR